MTDVVPANTMSFTGGQSQGRIQEFAKGGWSLPFPSSPLLIPLSTLPSRLEIEPLEPARRSGSAVSSPVVSGQSPDRKRIWCTLKLPGDSVSPSPKEGGGAGSAPL